jgi:hypothetical protein
MDQFAKETIPVNLEDEMRQSYLDYAMSVIVGRARRLKAGTPAHSLFDARGQ